MQRRGAHDLDRRKLLTGAATLAVHALAMGCSRRLASGAASEVGGPSTPSRASAGNAVVHTFTSPATTASAAAPTSASSAASVSEPLASTLYLQPLGPELEQSELAFIEATARLYFPFRVQRLPNKPLPSNAYYPPRKRYRAEKLLEFLEQATPGDAQVVVGLTAVDISTTKGEVYDWGILGLATISGKQCVISRFRAQRGARDAQQVQVRLAKTVVHEVGHTIGLPHCSNYGCIMEDGKGSVVTTDHERDVCADCRRRVGPAMLPPPGVLPW